MNKYKHKFAVKAEVQAGRDDPGLVLRDQGRVLKERPMAANDDRQAAAGPVPFEVTEPCPVCDGQGTIEDRPCLACYGTGARRLFHGTKADLKPGSLIAPGHASNFGKGAEANFVYLTGTLDAATWGAELALGEGRGRIYVVEPTGPIEDDPNLTDKKFPGNPTRSYRTREPLRVTGELTEWQGHAPEVLKAMKDNVERLTQEGAEAIND
jgi:hypothetical protein